MSLNKSYRGSLKVRINSKTACSLSFALIIKSILGLQGGRVVTRGLCFRLWRPVIAAGVGSE
jgi:hypothetical protein